MIGPASCASSSGWPDSTPWGSAWSCMVHTVSHIHAASVHGTMRARLVPAPVAGRGGIISDLMTQIVDRPSVSTTAGAPTRIRVGIIGATGYVGGELLRLLHRHPFVQVVGLFGRNRDHEPIAASHPHLDGTGHVIHGELP